MRLQAQEPRRVVPHDEPKGVSRQRLDFVEEVERRRDAFRVGPVRSEQDALRSDRVDQLLNGLAPAATLFGMQYYILEQLGFRKILDVTFMITAMIPPGVKGRSLCEIHNANWPFQLKGCVAVGQRVMDIEPHGLGVNASVATFALLMGRIGLAQGMTATVRSE